MAMVSFYFSIPLLLIYDELKFDSYHCPVSIRSLVLHGSLTHTPHVVLKAEDREWKKAKIIDL